MHILKSGGKRAGENIRYWRSVQNDVDPEYYEREPELGGGPGRPRTLNSDIQAKAGFLKNSSFRSSVVLLSVSICKLGGLMCGYNNQLHQQHMCKRQPLLLQL